MKNADGGILLEGRFDFKTITSPYQAEDLLDVPASCGAGSRMPSARAVPLARRTPH